MTDDYKSDSELDERSLSEILQLFSQVAVLSVLSDEEKLGLAKKARLLAYNGGEFIVRQGGFSNSLFIIHSGSCEVFVTDQRGFVNRVAQTERGDFFGEMSLLTGEPPSATVRALEDSTLVGINKDIFASVLKSNPKISEAVGKVLAKRQAELAAVTGETADKQNSSTGISRRIKSFFKLK